VFRSTELHEVHQTVPLSVVSLDMIMYLMLLNVSCGHHLKQLNKIYLGLVQS